MLRYIKDTNFVPETKKDLRSLLKGRIPWVEVMNTETQLRVPHSEIMYLFTDYVNKNKEPKDSIMYLSPDGRDIYVYIVNDVSWGYGGVYATD